MTDLDVVGYLDEVVELHATFDESAAHSGTVDSGVRTNLDIVLNLYNANLLDLVVYAIGIGSEAKAVGTDNCTAVEHTTCANTTAMVYFYTGVNGGIVANDGSVADIGLRIDLDILSNPDTTANVGKCTDIA